MPDEMMQLPDRYFEAPVLVGLTDGAVAVGTISHVNAFGLELEDATLIPWGAIQRVRIAQDYARHPMFGKFTTARGTAFLLRVPDVPGETEE